MFFFLNYHHMNDNFTEQFFSWADANDIGRETIAQATGNTKETISKWRSIGIPKGKQLGCKLFMEQHTRAAEIEDLRGKMILRPTHDQFQRWNRAALLAGQTIEDWAFDGLERMAAQQFTHPEPNAEDEPA